MSLVIILCNCNGEFVLTIEICVLKESEYFIGLNRILLENDDTRVTSLLLNF